MSSHNNRMMCSGYVAKFYALTGTDANWLLGVSRQAVLDALEWKWAGKAAFDAIKELPSVNPKEPKTGHWIAIDEEPHEDYECDKCGYTISTYTANIEPYTEYKYCPNCGIRMVAESEG